MSSVTDNPRPILYTENDDGSFKFQKLSNGMMRGVGLIAYTELDETRSRSQVR
jgi:hypothetical protein